MDCILFSNEQKISWSFKANYFVQERGIF